MNPSTQPIPNSKNPFGKNIERRGFLARIFAGAVAAPAVTKIIKGGVVAPAVNPRPPEWPTPYEQNALAYSGCTGTWSTVNTASWVEVPPSGRKP